MAVYYGLVTREDSVLAEYSSIEGDFSATARMLLRNTPASSVLKTYTQGSKIYNFYTQDSVTFLCYADISIGRELSLQFLTEMRKAFPNYANKAGTFAEFIKKLVKQYSKENIHEVDNFHKIETNLEKAVEATKSSIDKVISRGKKMSSLIEKTGELSNGMGKLTSKARKLHRNFWKSRIKALTAVFLIGIIISYCLIVWISQNEP
jgi:vesicle-associated membrane protein 7